MNCYVKDYPRPQMVRNNWENLNGTWDFAFDDRNEGEGKGWFRIFQKQRDILVPFTYETKLSGIGDEREHNYVWYHRTFTVRKEQLEHKCLLLHFEGSDFLTKVWVNGQYAGQHRGGYARFSFNITQYVKEGENELTVKAEDSFDVQQPRGKQRWLDENFACWYVQTTGIWKTVWMEYAAHVRLDNIKMTPDLAANRLELELDVAVPDEYKDRTVCVEAIASFDEALVAQQCMVVNTSPAVLTLDMNMSGKDGLNYHWDLKTWSPAHPCLYDLTFKISVDGVVTDEICSYCAMREIRIDGPNILLNGDPLYQRLILHQGYWKDSHLTPPSEEALINDIDKILELGFNGLRIHQKIEDERFLYWCDVKGLLVWSEAPASYKFTDYAVREFVAEWMEILKQNYNHPCIITWTPFNESWGINRVETERRQQHFTEAIYHLTKSIDPYRPLITNDGWEHTCSDIITLHDYDQSYDSLKKKYLRFKEEIMDTSVYHHTYKSAFANGFTYHGQPVIISELGGIAFDNDDCGWGYGDKVSSEKEYLKRYDDIISAIKEIPYICGFCYTQVTDVQQEINGIMDIDRRMKTDPARIREINTRAVGCWRAGQE